MLSSVLPSLCCVRVCVWFPGIPSGGGDLAYLEPNKFSCVSVSANTNIAPSSITERNNSRVFSRSCAPKSFSHEAC